MSFIDKLKIKYNEIVQNPAKFDRIFAVVLLCILLLVVCVVLILHNGRIDLSDDLALLSGFRITILTCVLITGLGFLILALCKVKLEWLFLAVAMGIGILYMFAITPLNGPDERFHYVNATHLSSLAVSSGNTTFSRHSDFDFTGMRVHENIPSAYLRLMTEGIRRVESYHIEPFSAYDFGYYAPLYLPQAIGISIGRLFQLNFLGLYYLGSFFNLLFYVLCAFFAIRALKEFKLPLFIIGLLPMTLNQIASFSTDSFIFGVSMLFIAYLIRCTYEQDEWSWKDITVMAVTGILLAPAKNIYVLIILMLLFAAPYKFGLKKAKGYLIAGGICVAALATLLIFNLAALQSTFESADVPRWHDGTNFTVSFIFENPGMTIFIFLNTLRVLGFWYFLGLFGRELGGLSIVLPMWYIFVFVLVLIVSAFYGKKDSWTPKWSHKVLCFAVFAAMGLMTMLGMFLAWTPDTHGFILGIQGRYFLPALPLIMLIFRNRFKVDKPCIPYALIGIVICMHFLILKYVLDFTISHF